MKHLFLYCTKIILTIFFTENHQILTKNPQILPENHQRQQIMPQNCKKTECHQELYDYRLERSQNMIKYYVPIFFEQVFILYFG